MNDEKYVYVSDMIEKKSIARSARGRRTHTGKRGRAKLPSDYLTKKELENMNGECKSYRLNAPMTWAEFKTMPDDIKVTYINLLRQKFNPPATQIAKMMGVSEVMLRLDLQRLNLAEKQRSGRMKWDKEGFWAWASGLKEIPAPEEEPVEEAVEEIPVEEPVLPFKEIQALAIEKIEEFSHKEELVCNRAIPESGNMVFEGYVGAILNTLGVLLGDAKVHISVTWDVVE